jgi:3-methyladenine DNA glycosylase/8-oxoguanine DNA glycosylase
MNSWQFNNGVLKTNVPPAFSLDACLSCGQTFLFTKTKSDGWHGAVNGKAILLKQQSDILYIENSTEEDIPFWHNFFAFDVDYAPLQTAFVKDEFLANAVLFEPGIRVLRQPFFETLLMFIISQNNNIPRISGIVGRLCEAYGTPVSYKNFSGHTFPTAQQMASCTVESLAFLRAGFRAKYIVDAVQCVTKGTVTQERLATLNTEEARKLLLQIKGVGPKVADCVLLFACGRFEVCPMDVWMMRVMQTYYPNGFPAEIEPFAGIAQQYLFHYARHNATLFDDKG